MHDCKLGAQTWLLGLFLIVANPKGRSSVQLAADLGHHRRRGRGAHPGTRRPLPRQRHRRPRQRSPPTTDEAEAIISARDGLGAAHGNEKVRFWQLHDRCLPEGQQMFRLVDEEASTPPDDYVTYLEIREFRSCPTLDDVRSSSSGLAVNAGEERFVIE